MRPEERGRVTAGSRLFDPTLEPCSSQAGGRVGMALL